MAQERLPDWEGEMLDELVTSAEERHEQEKVRARKRALQLAREQAYHRLAVAIDRPTGHEKRTGQLSLFATDPTLFDDAG
ncbi:MAG: hypothetical protein ABR529_15025 [Actinomycetota bacterium]